MARVSKGGVFVALLRGINLSGNNRLPMKELVAMLEGGGCTDVKHYIQSGNLVFRASEACAAKVPALLSKGIAKDFGFKVPVVTRTGAELERIAKTNPYLAEGADPKSLHVMFLAAAPTVAQVAALDPKRSPPDSFRVKGREIFLCCPNGVAKTKLTNAYFDSKLATMGTLRNLRTVETLVGMVRELEASKT